MKDEAAIFFLHPSSFGGVAIGAFGVSCGDALNAHCHTLQPSAAGASISSFYLVMY
jgi:hypothetical protein